MVFVCQNEREDFQTRILHTISGVEVVTRTVFRSAYILNAHLYRDDVLKKHRNEGKMIMVVHMRRGDVMKSKKIDMEHRVVSFGVYLSIIREILRVRFEHAQTQVVSNTVKRPKNC